jgi:hypothetical protein
MMDKELTRLFELRSKYAAALAATDAAVENRVRELVTPMSMRITRDWPSEADFRTWTHKRNDAVATKAWLLLVSSEMGLHLAQFGVQLDAVENRIRRESLFAAREHLYPSCVFNFGDLANSLITGWIDSLKNPTPSVTELSSN